MTYYLTKTYSLNFYNDHEKPKKMTTNELYNQIRHSNPTKIFGKMFEEPSVWMGYTDEDTKDFYFGSDNMNNTKYYSSINIDDYQDLED